MKEKPLTAEEKAALILACRWAYQNPEGQAAWSELESGDTDKATLEQQTPVVEKRNLRHD